MENQEQIIFQLILHGGNGRSSAMEAIAAAKQADFSTAREKLQESADAIHEAHKVQTSLIQAEAREEKTTRFVINGSRPGSFNECDNG